MLLDLESRRPTEVDFINGAIPGSGRRRSRRAVQRGGQRPRAGARAGHDRLLAGGAAGRASCRPGDSQAGRAGRLRFPGHRRGARRRRGVAARRANGRPAHASRSCVELRQGRQVVQDDCRAAFDDAAFHRMLETYGGLAAQIVTPIFREGGLVAIVSVHAARAAAALERRGGRGGGSHGRASPSGCDRRRADAQPLAPRTSIRVAAVAPRRGAHARDRGRNRRPAHARERPCGRRPARPRARPPADRPDARRRAPSRATCSRSSFVAYETDDFGVTAVIPGFGFLADLFPDPYVVKWELAGGLARSDGAARRRGARRTSSPASSASRRRTS